MDYSLLFAVEANLQSKQNLRKLSVMAYKRKAANTTAH
jgi:hypothetical protein